MSVFTLPLCSGKSMIVFINMWSIIVALVFVTLVGLFITGKILFWKARLKNSPTINTIVGEFFNLAFKNDLENLY